MMSHSNDIELLTVLVSKPLNHPNAKGGTFCLLLIITQKVLFWEYMVSALYSVMVIWKNVAQLAILISETYPEHVRSISQRLNILQSVKCRSVKYRLDCEIWPEPHDILKFFKWSPIIYIYSTVPPITSNLSPRSTHLDH